MKWTAASALSWRHSGGSEDRLCFGLLDDLDREFYAVDEYLTSVFKLKIQKFSGFYVVDLWIYVVKYEDLVTDFPYLNLFIHLFTIHITKLPVAQTMYRQMIGRLVANELEMIRKEVVAI